MDSSRHCQGSGGYFYDVINSEGVFVAKLKLNLSWAGKTFGPKFATIRNNKMYYCTVKDDKIDNLVVSSIEWREKD